MALLKSCVDIGNEYMNLTKKKIFITIKHNKNSIQKLPLFKGNIPQKAPDTD